MRSALAVAITLATLAGDVAAQQPPTDVELRASFCIGVMQGTAAMARGILSGLKPGDPPNDSATAMLATSEDNLRRLQSYVVPKMTYLDPAALLLAHKRGQTDVASVETATTTCVNRCTPLLPNHARVDACIAKCRAETPLFSRLDGCRDLNWLPF